MHLSQIKDFVSSVAVTITILQFLSGILVCKQYVVNRTTAEASPLPFICGVISAALWILYGLTKHDNKIVFVNVIGVTLMFAYTAVFYIFTFKKSSVLKQIFAMVAFIIFTLGYVSVEDDNELLLGRLGLLACSFTLLTIASPLSKLFYVLKVKCTECLPFPMILMSFFVSATWFLYGLIEEDVYITTPNFIGGTLAVLQLSLFLIFPSKPHGLTKSLLV